MLMIWADAFSKHRATIYRVLERNMTPLNFRNDGKINVIFYNFINQLNITFGFRQCKSR